MPGNELREPAGLRSPSGLNENIALAKSLPLGEHVSQTGDGNILNRVIFGSPDTCLPDASFGKVINSQSNTQRQGQAQFQINF